MQQHYELGTFYRDYLVTELHFLPSEVNLASINLRSSYVDRTFRSAVSFVSGLYPPVAPGEELTITSGTSPYDPLLPDYRVCMDLSNDWDTFQSSTEFISRRNAAEILYAPVYDNLNETFTNLNWMFLGDWLGSAFCSGQVLPDYVTDEIFNQSIRDLAFFSYGLFNVSRGNGGGPILREIFRSIDAALNGETRERFFLYSAHDSSVAAVLSTFGFNRDEMPRYRSHLAVEVWEAEGGGVSVRFVWDGEEVPIDLMGWESFVDYQELRDVLDPFMQSCSAEYE
jgi:acid phosphatase